MAKNKKSKKTRPNISAWIMIGFSVIIILSMLLTSMRF